MDEQRVRQLVDAAQSGYWPPHLGLNDDGARIEALGEAVEAILDGTTDRADQIRALEDETARLEENEIDHGIKVDELTDEIAELKEEIEGLKAELAGLKEASTT